MLEFVEILLEIWSTITYRATIVFLILIKIVSTMRTLVHIIALTK